MGSGGALLLLGAEGLAGLLHDGSIDQLIERGAAGGELTEGVVLLAHQESAVGKRLADADFIEFALGEGVDGEIRVGEGVAADAEDADAAGFDVVGGGVEGVDLEPGVAGADHGEVGKGLLEFAGDAEVAVDAGEGVLGHLVVAFVGLFKGAADVGVSTWMK